MLKVVLIALLGYFILSRLFGRVVIVKRVVHQPFTKAKPEPETRVEYKETRTPKSVGDYIDYEEIK